MSDACLFETGVFDGLLFFLLPLLPSRIAFRILLLTHTIDHQASIINITHQASPINRKH
jgi:hypothetical protein